MDNLLLLAFLVGDEDGFARGIGHVDGAGGGGHKAGGIDLPAVDEREREAVGEEGAELFHEVEGEPGPAGAVAVEEPDGRVEAYGSRRRLRASWASML